MRAALSAMYPATPIAPLREALGAEAPPPPKQTLESPGTALPDSEAGSTEVVSAADTPAGLEKQQKRGFWGGMQQVSHTTQTGQARILP